uniref:Uncharacterized protein n=1 Tax=Bionectria ochroleuca TaxID=29856 RepID=A0A8H7K442_BIOOC
MGCGGGRGWSRKHARISRPTPITISFCMYNQDRGQCRATGSSTGVIVGESMHSPEANRIIASRSPQSKALASLEDMSWCLPALSFERQHLGRARLSVTSEIKIKHGYQRHHRQVLLHQHHHCGMARRRPLTNISSSAWRAISDGRIAMDRGLSMFV